MYIIIKKNMWNILAGYLRGTVSTINFWNDNLAQGKHKVALLIQSWLNFQRTILINCLIMWLTIPREELLDKSLYLIKLFVYLFVCFFSCLIIIFERVNFVISILRQCYIIVRCIRVCEALLLLSTLSITIQS